ncbi:MAG: hypothetical protein AB1403_05145 [Candidatus Riflebacteria bacterium]
MGTLVTVGVNTLAFLIISKILPGFNVRNDKTNFIIAIAYSFLMVIAGLLVLPVSVIIGIVLAAISFIPVIGPLLAGAGGLVTAFVLVFCITAILLIIIDKAMDDFEMTSPAVAFIASFLLAVLNVTIRWGLGI